MEHVVQWVRPSPLWIGKTGPEEAMSNPAILAFKSDEFMTELQATMASSTPTDFEKYLAAPESMRRRPPAAPANWAPKPSGLKLYQPIHGRFYLVTASLVCRLPGLPERVVHAARQESVSFVLRRRTTQGEEAWVADSVTPTKKQWVPVSGELTSVAPGEQTFPMFPVVYRDGDKRRRVHCGLLPTASRDVYERTGSPPVADGAQRDERLDAFVAAVITPYRDLLSRAAAPVSPTADTVQAELAQTEASLFILLDFGDLLQKFAPAMLEALASGNAPAGPLGALYNLLAAPVDGSGESWRGAIVRLRAEQAAFVANDQDKHPAATFNLGRSQLSPDQLRERLAAALPSDVPTVTALTLAVPKLEGSGAEYIVRCVFKRPRCVGVRDEVVSAASQPFRIASFFDPDAPSRPIRIALPADTSIAGLRKYQPSVGLILSKQLRAQMCRVRDLTELLKGNLAKCDEADIDEICTLSIPIITIVATIILMIFVMLLNIIFWWLPFFRICFPIPVEPEPNGEQS